MPRPIGIFPLLLFFVMVITGYSSAQTYEKEVKKIVSERCLMCHGSDSPTYEEFEKDKEGFQKKMKGPRLDSYKNLTVFVNGKDAGALMRRLDNGKNTKDGRPGNMYVYLGATDAEKAKNLAAMKKWVGNWTLKRRAELTEAELKAIKAAEK